MNAHVATSIDKRYGWLVRSPWHLLSALERMVHRLDYLATTDFADAPSLRREGR
jgi:hypothetical protein